MDIPRPDPPADRHDDPDSERPTGGTRPDDRSQDSRVRDGAADSGHAPSNADAADDEPAGREERALDAATAERLSQGVRRDVHGEYSPDPYPDEEDPGDTTDDVIELHRRQADRLEHHPDVPRADD